LRSLLDAVASGSISIDEALERAGAGDADKDDTLRFATLDLSRADRTGFAEVVYCPGKSDEQIAAIVARLARTEAAVLATRANAANFAAVKLEVAEAAYDMDARVISVERRPLPRVGLVALVSAGTADRPVAAEAARVLDVMGNAVARIEDVGVAGLHRVLGHVGALRTANVVVVVAGMDGALPAVVAGLTDRPIVAVPTSVGYGASFQGLAALLTMLNSCAGGVSVVNIDGGFNAANSASRINHLVASAGARP
jgi:pyridinium-3,5-biscarboxylic acid mononucleotide synthase